MPSQVGIITENTWVPDTSMWDLNINNEITTNVVWWFLTYKLPRTKRYGSRTSLLGRSTWRMHALRRIPLDPPLFVAGQASSSTYVECIKTCDEQSRRLESFLALQAEPQGTRRGSNTTSHSAQRKSGCMLHSLGACHPCACDMPGALQAEPQGARRGSISTRYSTRYDLDGCPPAASAH